MVTSSTQLAGAANSSVDHPGVHRPSRSPHYESPSRSSGTPRPAPVSPGGQQQRQQQSVSSGPSVVSRYVLPTYRQANSPGAASPLSHAPNTTSSNPAIHPLNASLPDILHSHMVPQIPRLRQNQRRHGGGSGGDPNRLGRERHRSEGDGNRHRQAHHVSRGERRRTQSSSSQNRESCSCKEPCSKCVVTVTSFRWVLVVLSILGVCCVVSGIVLAALHAAGSSFLFLAIMFIGLGILLVIVVSVGWKCTPRGHEPLHALFHIGQFSRGGSRDRTRRRRHRHRDGNWFGGVFYPEFQYRRPPPSYAASMQDYQNQSLQEPSNPHPPSNTSRHERNDSLPGSPPPSYHSRTSTIHSGMNITIQGDSLPNSRPPTYRSRAPSRRPSLPRQDSPQQGVETVSDPSLPTTGNHEEYLQVGVVGESVTEPSTGASGGGGDIDPATAITITFPSPTDSSLYQLESTQLSDGLDASTNPYILSSHVNIDTLPDPIYNDNLHNSSLPQSGASERYFTTSTTTATPNQNNEPFSVVGISPSDTRDSTVVINNQPTTPSTSSSSFTSSSLPRPVAHSSSEGFQSDVQRLEQVLDPLGDMLDEADAGIDNFGANISTESTDHYDTHL